ncbi:MAG TPA: leucine--tRNA ligase [Dehalococcoidia bacterium]|nr:leucine--tRNA ligase [Dehalococcoidia bacterium]HIL31746.1 leucine--tRNA ligase [Dehalococcoidia bacterium]
MTSSPRRVELAFDPAVIDSKWQARWELDGLHKVLDDDPRPKWYEMTMYPYPSGDLHIGHWYAMAPADAHARFRRMQGYNVLHPIGFDAFGLPAENAAISRGIHPYEWTISNIENMRRQLRSLGAIYDWDREVITCQPEYYRWNQWFFLKFFEKGLAYRAKAPVVWCPSCQTVLANEQVLNGACERCGTEITRRDLEQWFFKITEYADRLLDFSGLEEWPDKILSMQQNWIGRSEGVEISFDISAVGLDEKEIRTFTTRIDTLFGVTFVVLAPEHPLVPGLTTEDNQQAVDEYISKARQTSEIDRLASDKEKTGVFTGSYAVNRINGERIPVYIGDYVLTTYGTGAVMGVPAHDSRDFIFAQKYKLPIRIVIAPIEWNGQDVSEAYIGEGFMTNSGAYDGMTNEEGKTAIAIDLEKKDWGSRTVSFRIRDWLISRQRYWGTPIPMVYCGSCGVVPVPEADLPVLLPQDADFTPTGESPLAANEDFVKTTCPKCGTAARRETDTMDTFMDSSWYMMRYLDPHNAKDPSNSKLLQKWMTVDQYTGGAEHAVMHLLYSRFFTKGMHDMGLVEYDEPFLRLFNQGVILGADHDKMSKSKGNVVNPDDFVGTLGADAVRCFLMFIGPWDQGGPWSDVGINGTARWLNRVWDIVARDASSLDTAATNAEMVRDTNRLLHQTVRKCHSDLDRFRFNTAIAALMELTNHLNKVWADSSVDSKTWDGCTEKLLLMLAPMAPHMTEELWEMKGHPYSIHQQDFPTWDDDLAAEDVITLVLQVNGKVRDKIEVSANIEESEAQALAMASPKIQGFVAGKSVVKSVYVPGRLVNVVVN